MDTTSESGEQTWKKCRTLVMCTVFLGGGLFEGIIGPSLVDLRYLYDCNYAALGKAVMYQGVGVLIGSVLGGYIVDRFRSHSDVIAGVFITIRGLASAAVPWAGNIAIASALFTVVGFGASLLNIITMCLCSSMWGEKAATPIHLLQFCFTLTLTIAPMLTTPFLYHNSTGGSNQSEIFPNIISQPDGSYMNEGYIHENTLYQIGYVGNSTISSRIFVPYAICGGIQLFGGACFFVLHSLGFRHDMPSKRQGSSSVRELLYCTKDSLFHIYFLVTLFFIYLTNRSRINALNLFLFEIAVSDHYGFSHTLAGSLMTVYSGSQALGRLSMGILAAKVPMAVLLWAQSILTLVAHILLLVIGLNGDLELWILSAFIGFFTGPGYPSVVAWTDRYIELKGYVMASIDVGVGCAQFISSWLSGLLFSYYDIKELYWLCVASSTLFVLVLFPLQILASMRGDRHKALGYQRVVNEED